MLWLWAACLMFVIIIVILLVKLLLLQKAADEIDRELSYSLMHDTNGLIAISARNKHMRKLAVRINEELRRLRKERRRFQQGDLEMKEAITNISHDLRTPLTAICGYLDLLEEEEKTENCRRYLEIIGDRTEILKQLTEELFRYTIVTDSAEDICLEELSVNSVLEESISAYYASLKGCQINPKISIPEKQVIRKLNQNALSRIFGNIISNAIKYSDGDLKITLSETGEIVFSNHASNLNEVQVSQLFNRFYTVETARKSTGLGLSIAKSLTEQMGGEMTAFYKGTVLEIRVWFPVKNHGIDKQ